MEHKAMNLMKSAMVGMAVGTAMTALGAKVYNDNKPIAQKAMRKAQNSKRIITRAGENVIREITD